MKLKGNLSISDWRKLAVSCVALMGMLALVAGCSQAATPAVLPATAEATATLAQPSATATALPTATATQAPTATATLEPTATATLAPTATPIPQLALADDGFTAWCLPESYAGVKPSGAEGPADANQLSLVDGKMQLSIPAVFCTMVYTFNQPVPDGVVLTLFDAGSPFLRLPLQASESKPNQGWAAVRHAYVINPPFWAISYKMTLNAADGGELWSGEVEFARPLPDLCPFGGLPNPVTMWCTVSDPWEIEPHWDAVYPYDRSKLPTPED